jgi:hypothetical protein
MVPFSFQQGLLISRGMKKHSSTFEVWTFEIRGCSEAWLSALGAFAFSYLLAFLILISAPDFSHRSVPPHLSDAAHPIQLSTKTLNCFQGKSSLENPMNSTKLR